MHTAKREKCQILWMGPFRGMDPSGFKKIPTCISELRLTSCGMDPPPMIWYLVEIFEILLLHVLSNGACKFDRNLFPISWWPFKNVNLLYCLVTILSCYYIILKMQIWIACTELNIAENPIKDINVNVAFLSSGSQVVEWKWNGPPRTWHLVEIFEILLLHVLSNGVCKFDRNLSPISWWPF